MFQYFKGEKCTVTEDTSRHVYDLNHLYNKTNNYVIASSIHEKFDINICGPIVGKCGSYESDVSVCWDNRAIGRMSTGLIYHDGRIQLKMTGQACRFRGSNSSVTIEFLCEMDVNAQDHNKIFLQKKVSCKLSVQCSLHTILYIHY